MSQNCLINICIQNEKREKRQIEEFNENVDRDELLTWSVNDLKAYTKKLQLLHKKKDEEKRKQIKIMEQEVEDLMHLNEQQIHELKQKLRNKLDEVNLRIKVLQRKAIENNNK